MDNVTRATPLTGMISRAKANIWHSLQAHKILATVALAVPEIFQGVLNSIMRHVALSTPTWGTVRHLKVSNSRGQTLHKMCSL